jgi:hypothetical protein
VTIVLAALDASPAARAVLGAAVRLGRLMGVDVEAVHVGTAPPDIAAWLPDDDVPIRFVGGAADAGLVAAVGEPSVVAAVFGARGDGAAQRPVGTTALHVLERATKPMAVVPLDMERGKTRFERLLVPLEGDPSSSSAVLEHLCPLLADEVELVALHVFTDATMPRALDRPWRDLSLWGDEFIARHSPYAARIELRTGPVGQRVVEVSKEESADMIVLSWSRDAAPGRAAVVREVLGASRVPVLLLPVDGQEPLLTDRL